MKKKLLLTLLTVILGIFAIGTITASAETYGDLTYTVSNGEVTITECSTSASGSLIIPNTIRGYPVKTIGERAFNRCTSLTNITIPDSVTSIGVRAFDRCTSLTNINIPDGVTSILNGTFYNCTCLSSIYIPNSVTSIGHNAFAYCNDLFSINIPDSVTSIGDFAFGRCNSLTSINIPDSVTFIGSYAFDGCSILSNVTIPNSITSISNGTFASCHDLFSINIPDSVTSIGDSAFGECHSLTSVTIPDNVTTIGNYAFGRCNSLSDVHYKGTKEEWFNISIGPDNSALTNATIHYNTRIVKLYDSADNIVKIIPVEQGELIDISDLEIEECILKLYSDTERMLEFDYTTPIYENLDLYISYEELPKYTYTFLNGNGTILKEVTAYYGTVITVPIAIPTKESNKQFSYVFTGWNGFSVGMTLTNNISFTPAFETVVNQYTYIFLDGDGTVLKEVTANYGTVITPPTITPAKEPNMQYSYTFTGWDGFSVGMYLTGNISFTPVFDATVNQYTYTFLNGNGTVLKEVTADYGTAITAPGIIPTKESNEQYSYTFTGWNGFLVGMTLTSNISFTPVFEANVNQYTYTFLDEDGTILKEETADYGTIITAPEVADKDPYTFDYWQCYIEGMELTRDITFTAIYKYKSYSIFADGLPGATAVTYNSDFTLSTQQKDGYIFKGYYTEENGLGTQIADENGNSIKTYNIVGNLSVSPYFESEFMDNLVLSGTTSAKIGDSVLQRLSFATNSDAMYLTLSIKYPAFLNYKGKTDIDFIETYIDAERTDGEYKYIDITCVYDYNGNNIPKNEEITPLELEFEVPGGAPVGNVQITAENIMLDGAETVYISNVVACNLEIMPKLADSIRILTGSTIDKKTQLVAEVLPEHTTNKTVLWSVSDESVAHITEDGILTPLKNGEITVTASATDGSGIIATKTVSIIAYAKILALDFDIGIPDSEFCPDVRDYTVYVGGDATSITLTPEFSGGVLRPNGSGIWIGGKARAFLLNETEPTTITLHRQNVTDMTDSIYTVTVIRLDKISATVSDDKKSFGIIAPDADTGDAVILALFNGDKLVEAQKAVFDGGIVPFTTDKDYTSAKVIALDSLSGMKPSCDYTIIK